METVDEADESNKSKDDNDAAAVYYPIGNLDLKCVNYRNSKRIERKRKLVISETEDESEAEKKLLKSYCSQEECSSSMEINKSEMHDLIELVAEKIGSNWKEFGRCMNFLESDIRSLDYQLKSRTECGVHLMKLFFQREQDKTSWAFWCNVLSKFNDGRKCIEKIKKAGFLAPQKHSISKNHLDLICNKIMEWRRFARCMNFNEAEIKQTQNNFQSIPEKNKEVMEKFLILKRQKSTWGFWKDYLETFDEGWICIQEIEEELLRFNYQSCNNEHSFEDLLKEISKTINDWKELSRLLNFDQFEIQNTEETFRKTEDRCMHLMRKFVNGEQDVTKWSFWRNVLSKFQGGSWVIYELEKSHINLFCEGSRLAGHESWQNNSCMLSHQYDYFTTSFSLDIEDRKEIEVNVGAKDVQLMSYESFSSWVRTRQDYYNTYSFFQELNTYDFTGNSSQCQILQNFKDILDSMADEGFAVKGYSPVKHYRLFGKETVFTEECYESFTVYLERRNVFLHIHVYENVENIGNAISKSHEIYCYFSKVHEVIQSSNSLHLGVVALNRNMEKLKGFCQTCLDRKLLIPINVLKEKNSLKRWISEVLNCDVAVNLSEKSQQDQNKNSNTGYNVKRDILTFQALHNEEYPSFANSGIGKTAELKKLIYFTPVQTDVVFTKNKHIFLTGGYGSGKSIVAKRKLETVISRSINKDTFYYICHDRQSKFLNEMELLKDKYPNTILICIYPKIASQKMKLSDILLEYANKASDGFPEREEYRDGSDDKNVHFFIDEFDGNCFDEVEIAKLSTVANQLKDSYIFIATQSLEYSSEATDNGFKYKQLQERANFSWFHLDYSMRCTAEINDFIKVTSHYLESLKTTRAVKSTFYSANAPVDIEHALDKIPEKQYKDKEGVFIYNYNQPDKIGHSVRNKNVNLYTLDASTMEKHFSIHVILQQILSNAEFATFAICVYDKSLYYFLCKRMQYLDENWTSDIQYFRETDNYRILLTDYASIRGYEFENFIFILNMKDKFMKFRYVECFSRATTSLYVLANVEGLSKDSDESKLLENWKKSDNVLLYNIYKNQNDDEYFIFSEKEEKKIKLENVNLELPKEVFTVDFDNNTGIEKLKFPWEDIGFDDIADQLQLIPNCMKDDNVNYFRSSWVKHQSDIEKLFENDEGLLYKPKNYRGCDPVRIIKSLVEEFKDSDKYNVNNEILFFGFLVHLGICSDSLQSVNFLLESGANLDIKNNDTATNIKLPFSQRMIALLKKYGLSKYSVFGKQWLGASFYFDDVEFFEHVVTVNDLDVTTYKVHGWYPLLRLALYHQSMNITSLLIVTYNVDINEQDNRCQKTVLHHSAVTNNIEFADLILKHAPNHLLKDKSGNTPYQLATTIEMKNLLECFQTNQNSEKKT